MQDPSAASLLDWSPDPMMSSETMPPSMHKFYEYLPQIVPPSHQACREVFGALDMTVSAGQRCRLSEHTGWHIVRETGIINLRIDPRACSPTGDRFIRMMLVRLRGHSQEVPVRQICGRHAALLPPQRAMLRQHVLQAAHDTDLEFYVHVDGPRPSVCYPLAGLNLRSLTIKLSSYCNDSCDTHGEVIITPRFRPMAVSITLETLNGPGVLARRLLPLWTKSSILRRHLSLTSRDPVEAVTLPTLDINLARQYKLMLVKDQLRSSTQRALGWNIELTEVRTLMEEVIADYAVEGAAIGV